MMRTFLLILLCFLAQFAQAQAPFRGGAGSGYAHLRLTGAQVSNELEHNSAFSVSPTRLQVGEWLEIRSVFSSGRNLQVQLSDVAGRVVWSKSLPEGPVQRLDVGILPGGLYVLHLSDGVQASAFRIAITDN